MKQPQFQLSSQDGLEWLEALKLKPLRWLLHAFSTRRGGPAGRDLDFGSFDTARSRAGRESSRRFLAATGGERFALAAARQIHSALVLQVKRGGSRLLYLPSGHEPPPHEAGAEPRGDALITAEPGVLLLVRTADCLPVLLADPRTRAVAAIHAGWRGALARIIEKTTGEMRRIFGSRPADLIVALGPSIRACCYEVGEDVEEAFRASFADGDSFFLPITAARPEVAPAPAFLSRNPPGHELPRRNARALDLVAVALAQLKTAGVARSHVAVADFCTSCRNDLFFSARREGQQTGRMIAAIGVRSSGFSFLVCLR